MRDSTLEHTQQIVGLLEAGTASRSDVVALFIYLREQLDDRDPVKDIAHCIAHAQRDRGAAFRYITAFIDSFIERTQNGGKLAVERLFPLEEVIEHLLQDVAAHGLNVQPEAIRQQAMLLRTHLGDILDGVEVRLSHPNVIDCTFHTASNSPNPPWLCRQISRLRNSEGSSDTRQCRFCISGVRISQVVEAFAGFTAA